MTVSGINPKYAIESNQQSQEYPAIQVTDYQPRSLDEIIDFCISEDSYQLIEDCLPLFNSEITQCIYNRESVLMHKILTPVRWVFLNMPRLFIKDKDKNEISYLKKGDKLSTTRITIARCFMLCLIDGELVRNSNGTPQIFTLNLTSNKTKLISSQKPEAETKTLVSLNTGLQKHYKIKGHLLHLASVELAVRPKEFQSSQKNTSSMGVMYYLEGNAKALSEEQQQEVFELINDEEIQEVFNDPFRLKQSEKSEAETINLPRTEVKPNNIVSRPKPKPVVKASTESPSLKPSSNQNDQPWSRWESENDALAWGLQQLPEMTMHKLRQEWEYVKPKKFVNAQGIERESKALAWFERIQDLKVVPF